MERPSWANPRGPKSFMGLGRVELPTSRLSGVRSNHLSYRPCKRLAILSICRTPVQPAPQLSNRLRAAVLYDLGPLPAPQTETP